MDTYSSPRNISLLTSVRNTVDLDLVENHAYSAHSIEYTEVGLVDYLGYWVNPEHLDDGEYHPDLSRVVDLTVAHLFVVVPVGSFTCNCCRQRARMDKDTPAFASKEHDGLICMDCRTKFCRNSDGVSIFRTYVDEGELPVTAIFRGRWNTDAELLNEFRNMMTFTSHADIVVRFSDAFARHLFVKLLARRWKQRAQKRADKRRVRTLLLSLKALRITLEGDVARRLLRDLRPASYG